MKRYHYFLLSVFSLLSYGCIAAAAAAAAAVVLLVVVELMMAFHR